MAAQRELEELLQAFADAWNRHDVEALMSMMTEDGVFESSAGEHVNGERYEGQRAVRAAYEAVFAQYPDARWAGARHFVTADRGVSEWTFTGTLMDGRRVEVNGCDLFTFRNGRIAVKNSFRKNRSPSTGPQERRANRVLGSAPMTNIDVLRSLYDAFGRGDIPTVLGMMSPDIKWYEAENNPYRPSGEAWIGPDAVLNNLFMRIGAEWDPFVVDVKAIYGAGDTVVAECRYSGMYKPTGKRLDCQACHIWDVKSGKITRFQQYVDTAKLQDAVGAR